MYFGSVRFFKHIILLVIVACVAIPTALTIHYRTQLLDAQIGAVGADEGVGLPAVSQSNTASKGGLGELDGEVPAYQSLYPDFYAPEHGKAVNTTDKTVYLTFDDGPSQQTQALLDILDEEKVKATFFVLGSGDGAADQRMRDILEQGHTLGMHSYSQDYKKIYASVDGFLEDMYQLFIQMKEATGEAPTMFRFPGGSVNAYNYGIYQELMAEMLRRGFVPCDWNLSSADSSGGNITAQEIIDNVIGDVAQMNRVVVLMHDSDTKIATVEALTEIIDQLRALGFSFDRLTPETKPILFGYRE